MPEGCAVIALCRVCRQTYPIAEMRQILPCLHIFCAECIARVKADFHVAMQKHGRTKHDSNMFDFPVCPSVHCYSQIRPSSDPAVLLNNCDNEACPRKLSFFESTRLIACQHELCTSCLEDSLGHDPPMCIKCKEPVVEADDQDACGVCKKEAAAPGKIITMKCCGEKLCSPCYDFKFSSNSGPSAGEQRCPEGTCAEKKPKKLSREPEKEEESQFMCKGADKCPNTPLNGFPSNAECTHEVCLRCLERMVEECEKTGSPPICPNTVCHQPYTIDTVVALEALLPQKHKYFSHFALENQEYDIIKDDSITQLDISPEFNFLERCMEIRVMIDGDDESEELLTFDKCGTVADFIREVRRVLRILPLDKIYGYYIHHDDDREKADKEEKELDEEIVIDANVVHRLVNELRISNDCVVLADLSGNLMAKTSSSKL